MNPSPYIPELSELPELADAGVDNIRTQGTLIRRKPPISRLDSDKLTFGPGIRELEAAQYLGSKWIRPTQHLTMLFFFFL